MAGHSKFKNIMHRKGAQDAKRAKLFTKLVKEVIVAAKINPDPDANPRLRTAIASAKSGNVPKDRIENAISKASNPGESDNYEEIRYEGFGPGGVAVIVEALTDNRNRTAAEVRTAFTKSGGSLGETGTVSYMFKRVGMIEYPANAGSDEDFFEATVEAGGNDCISDEDGHEIISEPDSLNDVREALVAKFGEPESAELTWKADTPVLVTEEDAGKIMKMVEALEDSDDVQNVVGNYEIPHEFIEKMQNG